MSVPGTGLLAALRRKSKQLEPPDAPDETRFAASSSAVSAMEHAVAASATPEPAKRGAARGVAIRSAHFEYDLDEEHLGEESPELTVSPARYSSRRRVSCAARRPPPAAAPQRPRSPPFARSTPPSLAWPPSTRRPTCGRWR
jgi:hypothetical protein